MRKNRKYFLQFIGKRFRVQGLNREPRQLLIADVYKFGSRFAFHCLVNGEYKNKPNGSRENFLCDRVIRNGQVTNQIINVLTA